MALLLTVLPVSNALGDAARETAAASSPRWPACVGTVGRPGFKPWDLQVSTKQEQACDRLALGYALLDSAPARSLALALEQPTLKARAAKLSAAQLTLAGQAAVRLGRFAEAFGYFEGAQAGGAKLRGPRLLRDFALAADRAGKPAEALAALSAASAQMGGMSAWFRQQIYIEAGALCVREKRVTQAIRLLDLARREPGAIEYRSLALALLATALELEGKSAQARSVKSEVPDVWAVVAWLEVAPALSQRTKPGTSIPFLAPTTLELVAAVLLEGVDAAESSALFKKLALDPNTSESVKVFAASKLGSAAK